MFSGTTVVVVLLQGNTLVCANSGDSRAILCSSNQAGVWYFTPLSRDHKPEEPDEANILSLIGKLVMNYKFRVRKCNGRIE